MNKKTHFADKFITVFVISLLAGVLFGCAFPGGTRPVVKIGLIAPFEGILRHHGYQRLYGVKLALQEVNRSGGLAGYSFELVALNDNADPSTSILQAQELVLDSDTLGVIGHWEADLQTAVLPVYQPARLAVMPPAQFTDFSVLPDTFEADFQALSGSLPNEQAKQAYLATYQLLQTVEQVTLKTGTPTREDVYRELNNKK